MTPTQTARAHSLMASLAARGPDLQPLSLTQALAHPGWRQVLLRLIQTPKP